jgi:hypothetical protein
MTYTELNSGDYSAWVPAEAAFEGVLHRAAFAELEAKWSDIAGASGNIQLRLMWTYDPDVETPSEAETATRIVAGMLLTETSVGTAAKTVLSGATPSTGRNRTRYPPTNTITGIGYYPMHPWLAARVVNSATNYTAGTVDVDLYLYV